MRQKLIEVALRLLAEKRYAGFRIAEVASLAGVSRGAQSHHFPFKDDLAIEAQEAIYQRSTQTSLKLIKATRKDPPSLLNALVNNSTEFFLCDDFYISLDLLMAGADSALGVEVKRLALHYRLEVEQAWLDAFGVGLRSCAGRGRRVTDIFHCKRHEHSQTDEWRKQEFLSFNAYLVSHGGGTAIGLKSSTRHHIFSIDMKRNVMQFTLCSASFSVSMVIRGLYITVVRDLYPCVARSVSAPAAGGHE
jgi:AcrR family transcriptional regulator